MARHPTNGHAPRLLYEAESLTCDSLG